MWQGEAVAVCLHDQGLSVRAAKPVGQRRNTSRGIKSESSQSWLINLRLPTGMERYWLGLDSDSLQDQEQNTLPCLNITANSFSEVGNGTPS